jgi:hypothetical protein
MPGERVQAPGEEARQEQVEDRCPAKGDRQAGVEPEDDGKVEGVPASEGAGRADKGRPEGIEEDLEDAAPRARGKGGVGERGGGEVSSSSVSRPTS